MCDRAVVVDYGVDAPEARSTMYDDSTRQLGSGSGSGETWATDEGPPLRPRWTKEEPEPFRTSERRYFGVSCIGIHYGPE